MPKLPARNRAQPRDPAEPRWVTGYQAASAYAGVPVRTLREWVDKGRLPAYRIGPRQVQFDRNDIDALRVRLPVANGAAPVAVLPLTRDDIRAVARELAALQRDDPAGQ